MYTPRVLSFSSSFFTPAAAKVGKLASLALMAGSLAVLAPQAHAGDFDAVVGAGIGAVAGAAIGKHIGGRDGAILGAGAGGLVGASIASQHHRSGYAPSHYQQPVTYYQPQPQYYAAPPVTYYQPRPQYRVVQPVTYYQPAVVAWQPAPHHRHHHGHRHGRHDRHHDGHHYDHRR